MRPSRRRKTRYSPVVRNVTFAAAIAVAWLPAPSPAATFTLYEHTPATIAICPNCRNWGAWYRLDMPGGNGVMAITGITTAIRQADPGSVDAAVLIEFYDAWNVGASPLHGNYLGNALLVRQNTPFGDWILSATAPLGGFFCQVGADDTVWVSATFGRMVGGQFQPTTPAGVVWPRVGVNTPIETGDSDAAFYMDGNGDRIYNASDGPYGVSGSIRLYLVLTGRAMSDCNANGFADGPEVACGDSVGQPACQTATCATGGPGSGPLGDPFGIGWPAPAACDLTPDNGIPDACDSRDCNANGLVDVCDIECGQVAPGGTPCANYPACGGSSDCNSDGVPDDCQPDCNGNGVPDDCDLATGFSDDCQPNNVPDECDIAGGVSADCDPNGTPDECERFVFDCDLNGRDDSCDILHGSAHDYDANGVPDRCEYQACEFFHAGFEVSEGYAVGTIDGQPGGAGGAWDVVGTLGSASVTAGPACSGGDNVLAFSGLLPGNWVQTPSFVVPYGTGGMATGLFPLQELSFTVSVDQLGSQDLILDPWDPQVSQNDYAMLLRTVTTGGAATFTITDADGTRDTGVPVIPGDCYDVLIRISYTGPPTMAGAGTVRIRNASVGTPEQTLPFHPGVTTINRISAWCMANGQPGTPPTFRIDDILYCRHGSASPFVEDCNGNGTADALDLAYGGTDCNGDETLDECQVNDQAPCATGNDCNWTGVPDACEIAAGATADVNSNGVPDVCEPGDSFTIGFETVEGFVAGQDIAHQKGWWHRGIGVTPAPVNVVAGGPPGFGSGANVLAVVPQTQSALEQGFGTPIYVSDAEPGVEEWSFTVLVDAVGNPGDAFYVNISDFCEHAIAIAGPGLDSGLIFQPTTGLIFTNLPGNFARAVETWVRRNGQLQRIRVDDGFFSGQFFDWTPGTPYTATVRVVNSRGQVHILRAEAPGKVFYVRVSNDSPVRSGEGTRHMSFSSDQTVSTKYVDDVRYRAGDDCDRDAMIDAEAIAQGLVADVNADGIPDRCQDCNANCTWSDSPVPATPADVNCLDPREIAECPSDPDCADCNANGIPDGCDVDANSNSIGWLTTLVDVGGEFLTCDQATGTSTPLPAGCYFTRSGGGSTDCDANDVPDECQRGAGLLYPDGDCDNDGVRNACEIVSGTATDLDGDGIPDNCFDCNHNGQADYTDLHGPPSPISDDRLDNTTGAPSPDGVPDECCASGCGADLDCDGDTDLYDYRRLQQCAGPVARRTDPAAGGDSDAVACGCADLDADGWVDDRDVRLLLLEVFGPPAGPPDCAAPACGADFDCDGDYDLADFWRFQQCVGPVNGGATAGFQAGCGCADLNRDGAVNAADYVLFASPP